ncbi:PREDICTED: uncharacterized protein LOC101305766 [Fragaria vesca subsp. vesca]
MVIEVLQDEGEALETTQEVNDDSVTERVDEDTSEVQLQILGGLDDSETMQVKGEFNNKRLHILVDTGASHNFIHPALLKKCKSKIREIKPLKIRLASGAIMQTRGQVTTELQLGKYVFSGEFYVLPVSGCEVVLGSAWLKTLGDITWNFETMVMKFIREWVKYMLQGETKAQATVMGCKTMQRLLRKETEAVMVQLSPLELKEEVKKTYPAIQKLIDQYAAIFQSPTSLPPKRTHDHRIELLPNTAPINESKCSFGVSQVEYLGHIISSKGVAVDPAKIECIKKWGKPATLKGLRGLLGLTGYYRKYVRNFGTIAKPLTDMLKKDNFKWTIESEIAFEALKEALVSTPVLAIPDFEKEFTIECDASDKGSGAVLSQEGHPIAYLSKALAPRHTTLSIYDKEMMAVVFPVQHWLPYLLGRHFQIYTDHRTIEHFTKQKINTLAQQKWLIKLMGYDYSIKYRA